MRLLPDVWISRFQEALVKSCVTTNTFNAGNEGDNKSYSTRTKKALWALELTGQGYLDAAHDVILGVTTWEDLDLAEYAATHSGLTNWSQTHPLSDVDDVIHSMIHRLEGSAVGEGGYTGYQNAKYWLAGVLNDRKVSFYPLQVIVPRY